MPSTPATVRGFFLQVDGKCGKRNSLCRPISMGRRGRISVWNTFKHGTGNCTKVCPSTPLPKHGRTSESSSGCASGVSWRPSFSSGMQPIDPLQRQVGRNSPMRQPPCVTLSVGLELLRHSFPLPLRSPTNGWTLAGRCRTPSRMASSHSGYSKWAA